MESAKRNELPLMTAKAEFTIREVVEADLEELSALAERIWRQHYTPIIGSEQVEYMLGEWYNVAFLRQQLLDEKRLFWVAQCGDALIGYIQASQQGEFLFIHKLYVAEEARGMGVGKALITILPEGLPLQLRVNRHNIDSIAFYQRYGFEIKEEDVLDIGNGFVMDDYVMEKAVLAG